MKVLFDYRKVRKTRSQLTTMIELDTFLRNENNKKDMYDMRLFYVVMPISDKIVKFGIAGAKDGKSGGFGRLAQYVHQYGVATDLNPCTGVKLLYLAGTPYKKTVELVNSGVYIKELQIKRYFRADAIEGRGYERVRPEQVTELFKLIDDKSNKSWDDIETDRRTSERIQQSEILKTDEIIDITEHITAPGKSRAKSQYLCHWNRPYVLTKNTLDNGNLDLKVFSAGLDTGVRTSGVTYTITGDILSFEGYAFLDDGTNTSTLAWHGWRGTLKVVNGTRLEYRLGTGETTLENRLATGWTGLNDVNTPPDGTFTFTTSWVPESTPNQYWPDLVLEREPYFSEARGNFLNYANDPNYVVGDGLFELLGHIDSGTITGVDFILLPNAASFVPEGSSFTIVTSLPIVIGGQHIFGRSDLPDVLKNAINLLVSSGVSAALEQFWFNGATWYESSVPIGTPVFGRGIFENYGNGTEIWKHGHGLSTLSTLSEIRAKYSATSITDESRRLSYIDELDERILGYRSATTGAESVARVASAEGLITSTQVNLNNAVSTTVRHSDLNYGRAQKRLALALDPLLEDEEYILTAEGKRVWEADPRTVDVDGVETQIYIAAGSPEVGTVLKPDNFKNAAMQLPTSLMDLPFGTKRLIPNGFTETSWPNLFGIAVREAAAVPNQPLETTPTQAITFSDLAVVGYTTVGADPYGVATDYSIANPGVEGVSFRQPNTATVAVGGVGGLYFKKHVSNYELKVKLTYKGYHPNASVVGANFVNSGIFVGNKKINFSDSTQISPWFFNGQTVAEPWGAWFDGTTFFEAATGGVWPINHEDSSYMIIQCMGNEIRFWMSVNSTTLNLLTWESGETLTLPKAESDTAGSFGIQMEGTDWDATDMYISPITAFSTDTTRTF